MVALLDTNVLVHAAYDLSPLHSAAATLVHRGLTKRDVYCIAPQNLVEFAAVVSRPRLVSHPLQGPDVHRITSLLNESRLLKKIYPRRGTIIRALKEGTRLNVAGSEWYDLFLAVTMLDAGVDEIVTEDTHSFRKLPFIKAISIAEANRRFD